MKEIFQEFPTTKPKQSRNYFDKNDNLSCHTLEASGMFKVFIIHNHEAKIHAQGES